MTADHKIWNQIDHKNSVIIQGVTPIKIGGCESLFGDELLTLDCVPKAIEDRQKKVILQLTVQRQSIWLNRRDYKMMDNNKSYSFLNSEILDIRMPYPPTNFLIIHQWMTIYKTLQ